jgi:hypothetical protein
MKTSISISIFLLSFINSYSQVEYKNMNFVISINEKVVINSISNFKIIALNKDNSKDIFNANFSPGNISILKSDYLKIMSNEYSLLYLSFTYKENCKKKTQIFDYKIELKKVWLKQYYFVLKIYNLHKKKYRKLFNPLKDKKYTYEYYYPGGQMLRVTKKKRKICNF